MPELLRLRNFLTFGNDVQDRQPDKLYSNLVFFSIKDGDPAVIMHEINKRGVKGGMPARNWRFVTHYGITPEDIDYTLEVMQTVMRDYSKN